MNVFVLIVFFLGLTASKLSLGTIDKYYQLNWKSFYLLPDVQKIIDVHNPDYELLDAAIFHATNEVREQQKRTILEYSEVLHRAAILHSNAMIEQDFHDHYNFKDEKIFNPQERIKSSGGRFAVVAENIAEYQVINTGYYYCPVKLKDGNFIYTNCKNNKTYEAYTYLQFARAVVDGWLNSPPHRKNLLSKDVQYVGCAARISEDPYKQKKAPFARFTQNLGGGKVEIYAASEVNNNNENKPEL